MTILSMVVVVGVINPWTFIPVVPNSRAVTYVFQCGMTILSMVVVVGIINPWTFIPVLPICVVLVLLRRYFLRTSRDIKRLEGKGLYTFSIIKSA